MEKYTGWVNELVDQYNQKQVKVDKSNPIEVARERFVQRLLRLGTESIKFKLPLNGMLFDTSDKDTIHSVLVDYVGDELNLPFEKVALEFNILTQDNKLKPFIVLAEQFHDVIEILVFNKSQRDKSWVSIRGLHLSINRTTYAVTEKIENGDKLFDKDADMSELREHINVFTQVSFGALAQLLAALSCSNITVTDDGVKPSSVKQTIRKSKGKLPLFTYKVLTVRVGKQATSSNNTSESDEEYVPSGKRAHIRRGHPRRYKSGLKIWVNACSVGNTKLGQVEKTYNIKS